MEALTDEQFLHEWIIRNLVNRYSRIYSEIRINTIDDRSNEYKGFYPDALFINYGQVTQIVEVETESTINSDRVDYWKKLSGLGTKLVLLVPKENQKKAMELCWGNSLAASLKIATYDVQINI